MTYDITAWLRKQPTWQQDAALRLQTKGALSDEDIASLAKILKGEVKVVPDLSTFQVASISTSSLRLCSLGEVQGIDKLSPRKPLHFGSGNLAVVYGHNGSGKSGYTRILKKACGKQSDPLRSNVYKNSAESQSCKIEFSLNDIVQTQQWDANNAINELRPVDIFDAAISDFYLHQESEAAYTPQELILFTKLVSVCEQVSTYLDNEKSKLVSKLPTLPQKFNDTTISATYKSLTNKTSPSEIASLTSFTNENEKSAQALRERLNVTDPIASAKKQREIKKQIDIIKISIESRVILSSSDFLMKLRNLSNDAQQKRSAANESAKVLSNVGKLDGIGQETWKALWEAARAYSIETAYQGQAFPQIDEKSRCVLCHQELDEEAKERLKRFEEFVKGTLETEAKSAEVAFDAALNELPKIVMEADVRTKFQAAELDEGLATEIWTFLEKVNELVQQLQSKNIPESSTLNIPSVQQVLQMLSDLSSAVELKAVQFDADATTFDREKAQKELLELEAKQWISQQSEAVSAEVELKKSIKQFDDWIKKTGSKAITIEAGDASKLLITEAYVARFNTELQKLGAKKVTVELIQSKNVKGKGKYRIQLKDARTDAKLTNVLSDGEKRIVSLAAFLADVTGRNANVPFVFDDPISSLDQDFEERTIDRLIELGNSRQVIVFTHRLSFLSILTDKADDDALTTICINSEVWGTGEPSDIPINAKKPESALKKLLNERIPQSLKIQTEHGQEIYSLYAQAICSDFRKLIERIVEIVFLADVVQRHRRAVNTMGKIQNLAKITKGDCDLIEEMMTKYSFYEHSQPHESPVMLPLPDILTKDIKKVIDWHDEFSKRKVSPEVQQ